MAAKVPRGTIFPNPTFDVEAECMKLKKAMKGMGTDEKAIIQVLTGCSNEQRQAMKQHYKTMYGKELTSHLKSELGGNFEDLVMAIMEPTADFYAKAVNSAIKGIGTKEELLVEVFVALNVFQLKAIKESYKRLFKKEMEDDVKSDTSGEFEKFLVGCMTGTRQEVAPQQARQDAEALKKAGIKKFGTDEAEFLRILNSRTYPHLKLVFADYEQIAKESIEKSIKSEFSGDIEMALLGLVAAVKDLPGFFAEKLYKSMKGMGTNDTALQRVIVCRAEFDMNDIKHRYQQMYGKSLAHEIKGETHGDREKLLLRLIGE